MGIKKIIKLSALMAGLTHSVTAHSATVILDFTSYEQYKSVCSNSNCIYYDNWDNPIVSNYQFSIDTSSLVNTAFTDAYNNNPTYTETLSTSIYESSGNYPDYSSKSATVNQTYSQYESSGSIIGDMRISTGFNSDYQTTETVEQKYTGNLPPELAPGSTTATYYESGYTGLSWDNAIGATPSFTVFDEADLFSLYNSLIGEQFEMYFSAYTSACSEVDMYGNCIGTWTEGPSTYGNGYAILTAATVVPVPAAFWLFGSGLIGLFGIARRKK